MSWLSFSRGRRGATRTRGAPRERRARTRASRTGPRARPVARTSREVPPPWPGDPRWDRERRRRTRDHRPRARMGRAGWRSTRARRARLGPLDRERTRSRTSRDPARRATRAAARCAPERARANLPSSQCRPRGQQRSQLLTRAGFSSDHTPREGCVRISERRSADDPPDASPWSPRSSPRRTPRPTAARCSTHSRSTSPTRRWSASSSSSSSSTEPSPASGCPSTCVPISAAAAPRLSRPDASSGVRHPVPHRLELLPSAPRPARPRGRASTTRANARPTPGALPVPPAAAPTSVAFRAR